MELSQSERIAQVTALRAEQAKRRGAYPVSYAQLRLWLLDRTDPGNAAYNIVRAFRLAGPLDAAVLERSIGAIVARHAPLRTTFRFVDGQPVQIPGNTDWAALRLVDLGAVPAAAQRSEVDRIARDAAGYRFDLSADAMLQAVLVRLAAHEHVLVLTLHHIAVDERSLEIFYAELHANYGALASGRAALRPVLLLQYPDYALWERARNASGLANGQLLYWKQHLAQAPHGIALPYARNRPPRRRFAGASASIVLTRTCAAALQAIARRCEATPFMTYLAAFYALLRQFSGATDLIVGSPISGRRRSGVEETIGFFANAVALRIDLSGDPSFEELVTRVKSVTLDAFSHCDVPFEHVVASVARERSASANPLFQVMFAQQPGGGLPLALPGVAITPLEMPHPIAKFDLTALVYERNDGVEIEFNYDPEMFEASTIAAMLESFREVFDAVALAPHTRLSALCVAPPTAPPLDAPPAPAAAPAAVRASGVRGELEALEAQLERLWEQLLDVRPIGPRDDFFALGGHSLLAVRLVERLKNEFGVALPLGTLFEDATIEHLARRLVARARLAPRKLQRIHEGATHPPVIFFHGDLSGGGFYVRRVGRELGDRSVYAFPPHGPGGGDVPDTFEAMAADYLEVLQREGVFPPYDLVGYCNGALVALEVGRLVAASGVPPPRVFAIEAELGTIAFTRADDALRLLGRALGMSERARQTLALRLVHRFKRMRKTSGMSGYARFAASELWAILRNVWRRTFARRASRPAARDLVQAYRDCLSRYRPGRYAGRIAVLTARDERSLLAGRTADWKRVSPAASFHLIPGDHLTSITAHAPALAHQLRKCLDD